MSWERSDRRPCVIHRATGGRRLQSVGDTAVVRTQPGDLPADELARVLFEHWAIGTATLDYLPIGFGSHHWDVVAADERWFLTVDDLDLKHRSRVAPGPMHADGSTPHLRRRASWLTTGCASPSLLC